MKNLLILLVVFLCFACKNENSKIALSQAIIQDYSNLLDEIEEEKLAEKIIAYEQKTSNQICIYTIDSLRNNENILDHATTIANTLGVGTEDKDNGLLILISNYDRSIAIATGYGTEKIITDSIAQTIISTTLIPKFKNSLYFEGIDNALDSLFVKWN